MQWRNGLISVVVTAVSLALPAVGTLSGSAAPARSAMAPAAPGTRAMWLWGEAPAGEVVDWAIRHGVREIFAHVGADVATSGQLPRLQELRQRADRAGIRLTALGGDARWTTDHAAALAWQRAVVATGVFAGLHVDVEPYLLPAWNTDRAKLTSAYLSLLDRLRDGSRLPVEADVPFWWGTMTFSGKNLATETLRRVSAVTVMSYRDTATGPNSMYDISRDWLARGATLTKRVRLGAETGVLNDCPHCTFAEEGATALGGVLAQVDSATRSDPAFAGIAVHHYDAWRRLPA